jgi:hypothetical protein
MFAASRRLVGSDVIRNVAMQLASAVQIGARVDE